MNGTVVVFGAGAIGRGLLGELFDAAGMTTVFVEVSLELVRRLGETRGYNVNLVGRSRQTRHVTRYEVLHATDAQGVAQAVASCQFAATAVGGPNLASLAPLMALGLAERGEALNILVCENLHHADEALAEALAAGGVDRSRFVCLRCSPERIVRGRPETLDLLAESGQSLYADGGSWRGDRPAIEGLVFRDNVDAFYARKIFTNNAGHALLAYRGHLAGRRLIHEPLEISEIRTHLTELLDAASEALARRFGLDRRELGEHVEDLMTWRYANRELADPIKRVARSPLRKLGPQERLVGLVRLLEPCSLPTRSVSAVIGAAMHYDDPDDPECAELKRMLAATGPGGVLENVCGLRQDEKCYGECIEYYEKGDR